MPQQFTQDQINKLKELGIKVDPKDIVVNEENSPTEPEKDISLLSQPQTDQALIESTETQPTEPEENSPSLSREGSGVGLKQEGLDPNKKKTPPIFPLLSISGLTLLSFGGLVLLKGNNSQPKNSTTIHDQTSTTSPSPTQVPKSIQHYLLTSQQYFSQAVSQQSTNNSSAVELLNNSIIAATEAIKEFPDDYRGYQQRGNIYQALIGSKPELIDQSISDFTTAFKLNSNSAEISRSLASLYAKKGDANKTIAYLNQTVSLEPTKAQNFYDLAKIQQQAGLLSQALDTYNKLTTLITDPAQKTQVETEKSALEKLIAQNPSAAGPSSTTENLPSNTNDLTPNLDSPTIQAMANGGLIVAAPEEDKSISVTNQTDSNSLSGNATLTSGQKEITISNNNVSSTSQVYVTITKGGKNENLQVLSKSDKTFTVGLDSPISENIEFKWWIIN
jgi:tetratricopeptide (TPR) repeat protein